MWLKYGSQSVGHLCFGSMARVSQLESVDTDVRAGFAINQKVRTNNSGVSRVLRHTLRTSIDFLSFRSPWEIIVAYLVAVLGFACIYTFVLARDFYHPYVKFEPIVRAEKARFERSLDGAIAAELDATPISELVSNSNAQKALSSSRELRRLGRDYC